MATGRSKTICNMCQSFCVNTVVIQEDVLSCFILNFTLTHTLISVLMLNIIFRFEILIDLWVHLD